MNYLKNKDLALIAISAIFLIFFLPFHTFAEDGFTQKDRELLIELKVKMAEIDKRFEQMDKRFEDMFHFFYILAGIFTSLVVVVIGFAYWDRRTMIREAKREAIEFMEKEGILRRILDALKELSREDVNLVRFAHNWNIGMME